MTGIGKAIRENMPSAYLSVNVMTESCLYQRIQIQQQELLNIYQIHTKLSTLLFINSWRNNAKIKMNLIYLSEPVHYDVSVD